MYGANLLGYELYHGVTEINQENLEKNGEWDLLNATQYTAYKSATVGGHTFQMPVVGRPIGLAITCCY